MRDINYKYFLYARKSSESEDRQMASIEDQIAEVRKIAEKYNLNVIEIISESKSAKEPGREAFNSMLKRIHKGEAQGILTWKLNRLARNPIDGGQISWMLQQNIIKHIQTFEREYNPCDNVLLMQVEFGMANQYVKDLSLDVKRGMRQKAERGWYPIMRLPVGYMHKHGFSLGVDDEIIPDIEQFQILKQLWNLLSTGKYTITEIKSKGDILGLVNKYGRKFSKSGYYKIFTNEFYCGYYSWRDKDGAILRYKGKHKVLISLTEFQKIQLMLNNRIGSKKRNKKYNFPYRGLIKCGECGSYVTPDHKLQVICKVCKHKYSIKNMEACPRCRTKYIDTHNPTFIDILYYHCSKSKGKCSQGSITKEEIEKIILGELCKIEIDKKFYSWAISHKYKENENKAEVENLTKKLSENKKKLERRISELISLRADQEISTEEFNLSKTKTNEELANVNLEIERLNINYFELQKNNVSNLNFALEVVQRFKKGDDAVKTVILEELASNLILIDKKLYITTKKPLSCMKNDYTK